MAFNRLIITYSENTKSLAKELKAKFPDRVTIDGEDVFFDIIKTKTVRNGNLTLSAILIKTPKDYEMLDSLKSLKVLGSYEQIFSTPASDAIYRRVWDYTKENNVIDSDGKKVTYSLPKKFCDFS